MKKAIITVGTLLAAVAAGGQAYFPLSDHLYMTPSELQFKKNFNYNQRHNRCVLTKSKGFGQGILLGVFGMSTDVPPTGNFTIVVQYGNGGPAYLSYTFYDEREFDYIIDFLEDNGLHYNVTLFPGGAEINYVIDHYRFVLTRELKVGYFEFSDGEITEEHYEKFTYLIQTGIEPDSPYLRKQEKKRQKKASKISNENNERRSDYRFRESQIIASEDILYTVWEGTYSAGTISPVIITERIELLGPTRLRYTRKNETDGSSADLLLEYQIDGNMITASYLSDYDGTVREGIRVDMDIYLLKSDRMAIAINDNYTDVKFLGRVWK